MREADAAEIEQAGLRILQLQKLLAVFITTGSIEKRESSEAAVAFVVTKGMFSIPPALVDVISLVIDLRVLFSVRT